ncbi:hypothetical protein M011DRAFT_474627 [Sporormia fimetaria CBS 119925]|uniref:RING-type domain-containing protein n=1 Tax=Sporormia fimetaria CBS 119925 TaxID=1340428 RepID=A0A6A6VK17_9PLEO|nr:hypothetical protein M011DRAFT_474627 [Sporormia fimetaria CBS 119925]
MDPESAKLSLELRISDLDLEIEALGDSAQDAPEREALIASKVGMQERLLELESEILAMDLFRAEYNDSVILANLVAEENLATSDYRLARELENPEDSDFVEAAGGDTGSTSSEEEDQRDRGPGEDLEKWQTVRMLYSSLGHSASLQTPCCDHESLQTHNGEAISKGKAPIRTTSTCCAYLDDVPSADTLTLDCSPKPHTYCRECVQELLTGSLRDSTLFPPRCCQSYIPVEIVRILILKKMMKKLDQRLEEATTPHPTWCFSCGLFIPSRMIKAGVADCLSCDVKTCTTCKGASHDGLCPHDPNVEQLMKAAKVNKWRQCGRCKNLVDLFQGCFHITCRCGHQFCYLCGVQWKHCTCPQFAEDYILDEPIDPDLAGLDEVCDHNYNERRRRGMCRDCLNRPGFVMVCGLCQVARCWRCIHNRA